MSDTSAERMRRYRAHRKGDHALCRGEACTLTEGVTPSDVTPRDPKMPPRLLARGQRVWDGLGGAGEVGMDERILIEEAARLADRLEKLDQHLSDGRSWFSLRRLDEDGTIVTVRIDNALGEARQNIQALNGVLAAIRTIRGTNRPSQARRGTAGGQKRQSGVGGPNVEVPAGVSDLAAKIAARRAESAG